jgi:hypothetical protein
MSIATTILEHRPAKPYRYFFLGSSFTLLLLVVVARCLRYYGLASLAMGYTPLVNPYTDLKALSITLSPALLLIVSVIIMLFAQWKPFERYW